MPTLAPATVHTIAFHHNYFELRSIDAWREPDGGWTWNDSFKLDIVGFPADVPLTGRRILKDLRDWHYLTQQSKGMLTVYYDGDIYEVQNRKTREPLFAFIPCC